MRLGLLLALMASTCSVACIGYEMRHQIQWDSRQQIWRADARQEKARAGQSRVFDGPEKLRVLEAVVSTFQDLDFQVHVFDEELGIVSGVKFGDLERPSYGFNPHYFLYDDESLVAFTGSYRSWGPFYSRSDRVRFTVTVREADETQLVVRASAQFYLRPVEGAEAYRDFFEALEQALFAEGEATELDRSRAPEDASPISR